MKKYRHKTTGNIAKETNSGKNYKVSEPRHFTVPQWIIENSSDWEEVIEKPLFTTEDGVEIFEGDTYWCVNNIPHLWSLFEQTSKARTRLNKTVLAFSTKEAAEEYMSMNKPSLSVNDAMKVVEMYKTHVFIEEKLKDIVKSKL